MRLHGKLATLILFAVAISTGCGEDKGSTSVGPEPGDAHDSSTADTGVDTGSVSDVLEDAGADVESDVESDAGTDSETTGDSGSTSDATDATSPDTDGTSGDDGETSSEDATDAEETNDAAVDSVDDGDASVDTGPVVPCPNGTLPATFGSELPVDGPWFDGELGRCTPYAHVAVGARESTYRLEVLQLPPDAQVKVFTPHYFSTESPEESLDPLAVLSADTGGLVKALEFSPRHSGEVVIQVSREQAHARANYEIRLTCESRCEKATTRFPLILLHGLFGTNNYLGVLDYWHNVSPEYDRIGLEYRVSTAGLFRNSDRRAEIIGPYIEGILEETGARKVNLLGHSQGGLDARIAASPAGTALGDRIASVTTLATPHRGVPIDLAGLLVLFGIQDFTENAAEQFNAEYVDDSSVQYYSWGGRTCGALELRCIAETGGEVVDPLISALHFLIRAQGYQSDGLVTVPSSKWGEYLGTLPADHLDEVGQIADLRNDFEPFDHVGFFIDEVYRLIDSGH